MEKFQITKEGHQKLRSEIEKLKNIERPKIIAQIASARELGDLRENAEYHSAKDRQGFIEGQIADLEDKLNRSQVVDVSKLSGNKIKFGTTVTLENLDNSKKVKYKIVSDFEANIEDGLISSKLYLKDGKKKLHITVHNLISKSKVVNLKNHN